MVSPILIFVGFFYKTSLALAVGSAMFALLLPLRARALQLPDASVSQFMGIVMFVFQASLATILASQIIIVSAYIPDGFWQLLKDPTFIVNVALLVIIGVNALLMRLKIMPAWIGGPLAFSSVFSLYILHALLASLPLNLLKLSVLYVAFTAGVIVIHYAVSQKYRAQVLESVSA